LLLQSELVKDIDEEVSTKINCTIDENRQSETEKDAGTGALINPAPFGARES